MKKKTKDERTTNCSYDFPAMICRKSYPTPPAPYKLPASYLRAANGESVTNSGMPREGSPVGSRYEKIY